MPTFKVGADTYYFAHIPKCAGTSIEEFLQANFGSLGLFAGQSDEGVSMQHSTWQLATTMRAEAKFRASFAVVRHPLARLVSTYHMRLMDGSGVIPAGVTLEEFISWAFLRIGRFPNILDGHMIPQHSFIGPETKVFRYEDGLDAVVKYVASLPGVVLSQKDIPRINHRNPHAEKLYARSYEVSRQAKDMVYRQYRADYERFGYKADPLGKVMVRVPDRGAHLAVRRAVWRIKTRTSAFLRGLH